MPWSPYSNTLKLQSLNWTEEWSMKQVDSAAKEQRENLVGPPWLFSVTFSVTLPHRSQQGSSPCRAAAWPGPTPTSWAGTLQSGHSPTPVGPAGWLQERRMEGECLEGYLWVLWKQNNTTCWELYFLAVLPLCTFASHKNLKWCLESVRAEGPHRQHEKTHMFRGRFLRKLHSHYVNSCTQSR